MTLDAWLPIGHELSNGTTARVALFEGSGWQIVNTQAETRALVVQDGLAWRWISLALLMPAR